MAASNTSTLKESIQKAVEETTPQTQENPIQEKTEEKTQEEEENGEEDNNEQTETTDKENEEETSSEVDEEVDTALGLLRALKDPKQSLGLVRDLALRVGLIQDKKETVSAEASEDIKTILKEVLSEEYPDLKDKLETVFERFQKISDKKITDLKLELAETSRKNAEKEISSELDVFFKSNNITDYVAGLMIKEMELIPPGPKISLKQYLGKIHGLVLSNKKSAESSSRRIEKINSNKKETSVRSLSSDVDDKRIARGSNLPSIKESIAMALEEMKK